MTPPPLPSGGTGITLNVYTGMSACMVLGIAVDDTIHPLSRFRAVRERTEDVGEAIRATFEAVGRSIVITTAALCLGFSIFALSGFQPSRVGHVDETKNGAGTIQDDR